MKNNPKMDAIREAMALDALDAQDEEWADVPIAVDDQDEFHVCRFIVPVYKLGYFGGSRPLAFKCDICGTWDP